VFKAPSNAHVRSSRPKSNFEQKTRLQGLRIVRSDRPGALLELCPGWGGGAGGRKKTISLVSGPTVLQRVAREHQLRERFSIIAAESPKVASVQTDSNAFIPRGFAKDHRNVWTHPPPYKDRCCSKLTKEFGIDIVPFALSVLRRLKTSPPSPSLPERWWMSP